MTNNEAKLKEFEKIIFGEANERKKAILAEAEKEKAAILQAANDEAGSTAKISYEIDEKKIKAQGVIDISKAEIESDREVIIHRKKLIDGFFDEIRKELLEYSKTSAYKARLEALAKDERVSGDAVIIARESDLELVKSFSPGYNFTVEVDRSNILGGLTIRLSNGRELIDNTFETAVLEEYERFIRESGLGIK